MEVQNNALRNPAEKITLVSSEGTPFYLARSIVEKSPVLKMILRNGIEKKTNTIALKKIDFKTVNALQLLLVSTTQLQPENNFLDSLADKKAQGISNLIDAVYFLQLEDQLIAPCPFLIKNVLLQNVFPAIKSKDVKLYGSSNSAKCIAADRNYFTWVAGDNMIKLLNKQTNEEVWLSGHTDQVSSVLIDGKCIISGSHDKTVKVWDTQTGKKLGSLQGHNDWVECIAVDNDSIVSGSHDGMLIIWDKGTYEQMYKLQAHASSVTCVATDGNYIISGSQDATLIIWNKYTGKKLHILKGHKDWVSCVVIDGDRIISGSRDNIIKIWNKYTGNELGTLHKHTKPVTCLAVDEDCIFSGSDDGTIKIWNKYTGNALYTLPGEPACCLVVDGDQIITGFLHDKLVVWDLFEYHEFRDFLNRLLLPYADLFARLEKAYVTKSKIKLSTADLGIYHHFLNVIKENWGEGVKEEIKQILVKKYK